MAQRIDPEGYYNGRRMRNCSDTARLYWPPLFLAADGFGRLELDFESLIYRCFRGFKNPPTEEQLVGTFMEYRDSHLAFLYEAAGQLWCQFWAKPECRPRYHTKRDEESPKPPDSEYQRWLKSYPVANKGIYKTSQNLLAELQKIPREKSSVVLCSEELCSEESQSQHPPPSGDGDVRGSSMTDHASAGPISPAGADNQDARPVLSAQRHGDNLAERQPAKRDSVDGGSNPPCSTSSTDGAGGVDSDTHPRQRALDNAPVAAGSGPTDSLAGRTRTATATRGGTWPAPNPIGECHGGKDSSDLPSLRSSVHSAAVHGRKDEILLSELSGSGGGSEATIQIGGQESDVARRPVEEHVALQPAASREVSRASESIRQDKSPTRKRKVESQALSELRQPAGTNARSSRGLQQAPGGSLAVPAVPQDSARGDLLAPTPTDNGFAAWYAGYPRKVGKSDAMRRFTKQLTAKDLARLLETWPAWQAHFKTQETRHVPHPARFINSRHWEEPPPPLLGATAGVDPQLERVRAKMRARR